MKDSTKLSVVLMVFLVVYSLQLKAVHAEIPHLINYQGKLTDSGGQPITATKAITFRIYNVESGSTSLWQETQSVTINKGVFNVLLGSVNDLNLTFDVPYYLGIQVGGDAEMTPRQRITSSGYALRAETVDKIGLPFYISGLELKYIDSKHIKVTSGVADIAGVILVAGDNVDISIDNALNYIEESIATANSWIYVYVYDNNNAVAYKLSANSPNKSDCNGNETGIKRYRYHEANYYRCIGAVRTDENGNLLKWFQRGNIIMWDVPITLTTDSSRSWSSAISCSLAIPAISRFGIFGVSHYGSQHNVNVRLRPEGGTGGNDRADGIGGRAYFSGPSTNALEIAGRIHCPTDELQRINYMNGSSGSVKIKIEGYILDIL